MVYTRIGHAVETDQSPGALLQYYPDTGPNLVAAKLTIPPGSKSGWVRSISLKAAILFPPPEFFPLTIYPFMYKDQAEGGGPVYVTPTIGLNNVTFEGEQWFSFTTSIDISRRMRVESGKSYWPGFITPFVGKYFKYKSGGTGQWGSTRIPIIPGHLPALGMAYNSDLAIEFNYQENVDPSKGAFSTPTADQAFGTTQPTFAGTLPHLGGDGEFDQSQFVQLQVWRTDTNVILYDRAIDLGVTDLSQSPTTFSQAPVVLPPGVPLKCKYRHQDSWGAWSPWSEEVAFTCVAGPDSPAITTPIDRINQVSGITYAGVYHNESTLPSNAIQIRIWNSLGTQVIYDSGTVAKVVSNGGAWTHAQWHPDLLWGTSYQVEVRFRARNAANTADIWGPYTTAFFHTNAAPYPPSSLTPSGNIDTNSTLLHATAIDPDEDAITSATIELYDLTTNAPVTGLGTPTVSGADVSLNVAGKLTLTHQYRWRVSASDGFVQGDFSDWSLFRYVALPLVTLLAPNATPPFNYFPDPSAEYDNAQAPMWTEFGRNSGKNVLTKNQSSVETDTTGLSATAGAAISRSTTRATQGSASLQCITSAPNAGMFTNSGAGAYDATAGQPVSVKAQAFVPAGVAFSLIGHPIDPLTGDPLGDTGISNYTGTGDWQDISLSYAYMASNYRAGLKIQVASSGTTFWVDALQAEVASAPSEDWEEGSEGRRNTIDRVSDGDAAFGVSSWEARTLSSDHYYLSSAISVDAPDNWVIGAYMKNMDSTLAPVSSLGVECYNSVGALLGTIYPGSINATHDITPTEYWSPLGGVIYRTASSLTPKWPAGTTSFRLRWTPSSTKALVRLDALWASKMVLITDSAAVDVSSWYGYFDGDAVALNAVAGDSTYSWTGDTGNSRSFGQYVSRLSPQNIYISYSHPQGLLKVNDRLTIEQLTKDGYKQVYQTPWGGGNRTVVPVPSDILKDNYRYRLKLEVIDTAAGTAASPPIITDVNYEGPRELNILVAQAVPDLAEVSLTFDSTTLGIVDFAGIEIATGPEKTVVDLINDPNVTTYRYPYPISGREEDYWVRQVRNTGLGQMESRWDHVTVQVDYSEWWLKDVEDPYNLALPVKVFANDSPTVKHGVEDVSYRPFGSPSRVHVMGQARLRSGSMIVRILLSDPQFEQKLDRLAEIIERRKTMCLLSQRPPARNFVQIKDIDETAEQVPLYATYELAWEEASFAENWFEREGVYFAD